MAMRHSEELWEAPTPDSVINFHQAAATTAPGIPRRASACKGGREVKSGRPARAERERGPGAGGAAAGRPSGLRVWADGEVGPGVFSAVQLLSSRPGTRRERVAEGTKVLCGKLSGLRGTTRKAGINAQGKRG